MNITIFDGGGFSTLKLNAVESGIVDITMSDIDIGVRLASLRFIIVTKTNSVGTDLVNLGIGDREIGNQL